MEGGIDEGDRAAVAVPEQHMTLDAACREQRGQDMLRLAPEKIDRARQGDGI